MSMVCYYEHENEDENVWLPHPHHYQQQQQQQERPPAESLYSIAMDDFRRSGLLHTRSCMRQEQVEVVPSMHCSLPPLNGQHHGDKFDGMTLNELLEFSVGEDEEGNYSTIGQVEDQMYVNLLEPTPLDIPDCQTVAQATGQLHAINAVRCSDFPCMVRSGPVDMSLASIMRVPDSVVTSLNGNQRSDQNCFLDFDETDDVQSTNEDSRFLNYQADLWNRRFQDLVNYRQRNGNCLVPLTYSPNPALARWVKRQRYQYKLMMEGRPSNMTPKRAQALEEIGFVWHSQRSAWWDRFEELVEFKRIHKHCNVPSSYSKNQPLAVWVKCQRRQYKLFQEGQASNMTAQRIRDLESIGFQWILRSYHKMSEFSSSARNLLTLGSPAKMLKL